MRPRHLAPWLLPLARAINIVGNSVHPWPGRDDSERHEWPHGRIVIDAALCFPTNGTVELVEAYVHAQDLLGAWPEFCVTELVSEQMWTVRGTSNVSTVEGGDVVGEGPVRLRFGQPMQVAAGQCLCWRYPPGSLRGLIGFAGWPGEPWQGPPGGTDGEAVALLATAGPLQINSTFSVELRRRRRYAVRAVLMAVDEGGSEPPRSELGLEELRRACWDGKGWEMFLTCCLPAGKGKPSCFVGLSYRQCCIPELVGESLGFDPAGARLGRDFGVDYFDKGGNSPRTLPKVKVDMLVRTYHQKLEELTLLLHSASIFWPADWGVIVALDGGSEVDAATCKLMPAWVRCVLVDPPPFFVRAGTRQDDTPLYRLHDASSPNLSFPSLGGSGMGMVWKEWSECWADKFSSADFIAIMDSDVVLTTFATPYLLFNTAPDAQLRSVIWGHSHENYFPSTLDQLQLPNLIDFMDSFPLTIRRQDFPYIRRRILALFGQNTSAPEGRRGTDFDWAFIAYVHSVHAASIARGHSGECPSFHAIAGSLLWYGPQRDKYDWYIRHGHLVGVPLELTCPRLHVAYHVSYWNHEGTENYDVPSLKPSLQALNPLASVGYAVRATALIMAGLCEMPWRQRERMLWKKELRRQHRRPSFILPWNATRALGPSGLGLEDVHRDLCEHGSRLVTGASDPFQRLLSWRFPAAAVSEEEAAYCRDRRPSALRAAYRRLMGSLAFTPT